MAELEIHTETEGGDAFGRKIGALTAVIAVFLAVVTIISHRAHTDAVLQRSQANDKWTFYQAERIKLHNVEVGEDLMKAIGAKGDDSAAVLQRYGKDEAKYKKESAEIQEDARKTDEAVDRVEARALRFDFGEGLLEIGMVLTSMYFISRVKMFPVAGSIAAIAGIAAALSGYLT